MINTAYAFMWQIPILMKVTVFIQVSPCYTFNTEFVNFMSELYSQEFLQI